MFKAILTVQGKTYTCESESAWDAGTGVTRLYAEAHGMTDVQANDTLAELCEAGTAQDTLEKDGELTDYADHL